MHKYLSWFHDSIRFLHCLTLLRIINMLWLEVTFLIARGTRLLIRTRGPFAVSIEPTTHCNLRCPECPSGLRSFSRPTGKVSPDAFSLWLSEVAKTATWMNLYFQGEPFLHPELEQLIRASKKKRLYAMTSTNGHFLTEANCRMVVEAGLDRLVISLDGLTQDSYEQYRIGGDVETVITGIERLGRIRKEMGVHHPMVVVQFLVLGSNEHQVSDFRQWAQRPGIDMISLKSAQFYNLQEVNKLLPKTEGFLRYRQLPDGRYTTKGQLPNRCKRTWTSVVITWDGLVVPCCYDKDADHRLGDLQAEPFRSIWRGKARMAFIRKVFRNRKDIAICGNCDEGLRLKQTQK